MTCIISVLFSFRLPLHYYKVLDIPSLYYWAQNGSGFQVSLLSQFETTAQLNAYWLYVIPMLILSTAATTCVLP